MNEKKFKELFYQYLDGELDENIKREVEEYLNQAPLSVLELQKEKDFDKLIRKYVQKEEAPFDLREKIIASIEKNQRRGFFSNFDWLKVKWAPAMVGLMAVGLFFGVFVQDTNSFPVFGESIAGHKQVLQGSYPLEIKTTDFKEISQWFEGKLAFAIPQPDFTGKNVKLLGARICHLKDRKAALLSYEVDGHKMTMFVVDFQNTKIPESKRFDMLDTTIYIKDKNGYQSALCLSNRHKGIGCIFVSDLPEDQLLKLLS